MKCAFVIPNSSPWYTYGVPRIRCSTVPSVFALSTRWAPSSPQRETIRGWSWLFQYREFQPTSARPSCQAERFALRSLSRRGARSHFEPPGAESRSTCSNVKTMFTSPRSAPEYSAASATVAPGVSPTVMRFRPARTSRFIS